MKKLLFIVALFVLFSCKKDETNTPVTVDPKTYCATCKEAHSGVTAKDYCGTSAEVDKYIKDLKQQGANLGQSWSCTKH